MNVEVRLSSDEVMALLPQGPPFRMVDDVELLADARIIGRVHLGSAWQFRHAPGRFPAICFIEAAMQAATCALLRQPSLRGKYVIFAGIKRFEAKGRPAVGSLLVSTVTVESLVRDRGGVFRFTSSENDRSLASGDIRFAVVDEEQIVDAPPFVLQEWSESSRNDVMTYDALERAVRSEYPDLLVQRGFCCRETGRLHAIAAIAGDSRIMEGHFKRVKILNGLFILQMCEQMANGRGGEALRIVGAEGVAFKKINHPGDVLAIQLDIPADGCPTHYAFRAYSENVLSAKGHVLLAPEEPRLPAPTNVSESRNDI